MIRSPRKVLHLKNKSSAYTPKGAGSALVIGKIALIMLVAAGLHCQIKLPAVGFLRCNKMPLRGHEMIYIFNNGNIDDINI